MVQTVEVVYLRGQKSEIRDQKAAVPLTSDLRPLKPASNQSVALLQPLTFSRLASVTTDTQFAELVEIVKMLHKIERTMLDARFSMLDA